MADNNRRIEYMAVSELMTRLHPQNPKEHDIPMIAQSFMDHGFVSSGTLDERTGLFLCGHGRTEALQYMIDEQMDVPRDINVSDGEWYCPVECGYSSLNDAQALAYIAIDNQATIAGDWDKVKLVAMLTEIKNSDDIELPASGFNEEQLKGIMTELANQKEPPEEGDVPIDHAEELNEKWQVELGDIWEIPSVSGDGTHRIMCGDSTRAEDVELLMDGMKADLILTDPPYGEIAASWDIQVVWWLVLDMIIKNDSYLSFTTSMKYWLQIAPDLSDAGWVFRWDAAWNKPQGMVTGSLPARAHENIACYVKGNSPVADLYFDGYGGGEDGEPWNNMNRKHGGRKGGGTYDEKLKSIPSKGRDDGRRWITTSWYETKGNIRFEKGMNPTAKPVRIFEKLVLTLCPIDGNVYDPFLGSGTAIVAAEQTGRTGSGMELHPPYVAITLERLSALGLAPVRVESKRPIAGALDGDE